MKAEKKKGNEGHNKKKTASDILSISNKSSS
jgi:hypothetical protein